MDIEYYDDDDDDGLGLQEMESAAVSTRQERNSILQVMQGWITRITEMITIPWITNITEKIAIARIETRTTKMITATTEQQAKKAFNSESYQSSFIITIIKG